MGTIDSSQWNEPPTMFQQDGKLRVVEEVERRKDRWELFSHAVSPSKLKTWLAFAARWEKTKTPQNAPPIDEPIPVPDGVVEHMFNMGAWPLNCFPPLRGVSAAPAVREDGSVIELYGYDPDLAVYLRPTTGLKWQVVTSPTDDQVRYAKDVILNKLLGGFDFASQADQANALALLLTGVLRWGPCSEDLIPLAVLDASMQGTGKGTLASVISAVWGGSGALATYPESERELKLSITSVLLTDNPVVIWDNVERDIDSPALAGLLTGRVWSDRILGGNEYVSLPNDRLWMVTGNNVKLGRDLPRRSIWIRQEPKVNPITGVREFKIPNILGWLDQNLGEVWWALLTMVRHWVVQGMTLAKSPAARSTTTFDGWASKVGGIMEACGVDGFLDNRAALLHEDSASEELQMLVAGLAREWPNATPFRARDVVMRLSEPGADELLDAMPAIVRATIQRNGDVAKSLGKWLEHHRNQIVDELGGAKIEVVEGSKPKQFYVSGGSAEVYTGGGLSVVAEAYKALGL
jgi:hypothetical protein